MLLPKPRVRERIFDTACKLFGRHGIHRVGVDAIVAEAGSNKMSFYRSFASKDALVAQYLLSQEREYWVRWDAAVAKHPNDPRLQVEALFAGQLAMADSSGCRGCALGNAAVEISDDEDPVHALVRAYKQEVRRRLQSLARAMGAKEAESLGDAMMLLLEGGHFSRVIFPRGSGPIAASPAAVRALIEAYVPLTDLNNSATRT